MNTFEEDRVDEDEASQTVQCVSPDHFRYHVVGLLGHERVDSPAGVLGGPFEVHLLRLSLEVLLQHLLVLLQNLISK